MGVTERRQREREVRRELVIDAAMAIYAEEGYHAITMEKIAERSEVSRAALYLYFKNKEEIVLSAIVSHADYFADLLQEVYEKRESIKENLFEELWRCYRAFYEKDPVTFSAWQYLHQREMVTNLSQEFPRHPLPGGIESGWSPAQKIVGYGVTEQIFTQCDPQNACRGNMVSVPGYSIHRMKQTSALSQKNHMAVTMDSARQVLSQGVSTRPEEKQEMARQRVGLTM